MTPRLLVLLLLAAGCSAPAGPGPGPRQPPAPLPAAEPTSPPHCTGPTPRCASFGYRSGATGCTREGDIELTACVGSPLGPPLGPPLGSPLGSPDALPELGGRCGNGKVDTVKERACALCVAGSTNCPCATVKRKLEQCDGRALDGQTCARLGFLGGALACDGRCRFDTAGCTAVAPGLPSLAAGGLAGLSGSSGFSFPGALGAMRGTVAAAWTIPGPDMQRDVVFAWADPALRVLRAAPRLGGGNVSELRLSGNERGWLLAVSRFGDNPGPAPASIVVYPVSAHGHAGPPGAAVPRSALLFLQRGAPGEPGLVGAQGSVQQGGELQWTVDGWLVDDAGAPLTPPFQIGTTAQMYSKLAARAAYLGGRFFVVRGTTRDPALEVSIVERDGAVRVLPTAHRDLAGAPIGVLVSPDRIVIAYVRGAQSPGTWLVGLAHDGAVVDPPRRISKEPGVALLGPASAPAILTATGKLQPADGGDERRLLGGAGLFVPMVAESADGAFALAITQRSAAIVKLQ